MVNKIFKAASANNQDELNSLLDKVEERAREMVKPTDLPDLPPMAQEHDTTQIISSKNISRYQTDDKAITPSRRAS